ncbi:MAG: bifunctional DNA-formamidopyrimidine glycosylase/DNA-(apurinic or apyrimidinic site) lyase [Planctomycetaceae bacterium]|nr:bifunctional DNA-formamidopyrimidine glycosylase/DNA-(apurinic or apyrimidinic site) lyase [Planctomycetaceae bacterium]
MPELPEVETMVRGIRPHVEGRRIIKAARCRCAYRPIDVTPSARSIGQRSKGQLITRVKRLAKRIILELESGDAFVIEPRMTGLMLVSDPPDRTHLRFEWQLEERVEKGERNTETLLFWDRRGLGTLRLYSQQEMAEALGPSKLGPDALSMTLDDWRGRLPGTQRAVKVALLDQKLVAGIGNLYASEILHLARIHPGHPSDRLKVPHLKRLHAATQQVLQTAIRYEGSTLADGTYRNALNQNGSYQNEHRVYARADEPCPTCGKSTIVRIVQAQRSTFYCQRCQPEKW